MQRMCRPDQAGRSKGGEMIQEFNNPLVLGAISLMIAGIIALILRAILK